VESESKQPPKTGVVYNANEMSKTSINADSASDSEWIFASWRHGQRIASSRHQLP